MAGTILCGVNESAGARSAARVAGALSKRLELRLVLVHVADAFTVADGSAGNDESVTTMRSDLSRDIARVTPCPVFVVPPASTDRVGTRSSWPSASGPAMGQRQST